MLPFNIFDQRPIDTKILKTLTNLNIDIYARSVFLQGLLLMNYKSIPNKFNKWKKNLRI